MAAREFMERATLDALEQTSDGENISHTAQHSISKSTRHTTSSIKRHTVSENTKHSISHSARHTMFDSTHKSDTVRQCRGRDVSQLKHSQSMFMDQPRMDENSNQRTSERPTIMHSVKQKFNSNIEHYSNMLHGIGLPMLFGKSTQRSRSNSRNRRRRSRTPNRDNENGFFNDRCSDDEDYVFVENIELYQLDGILLRSQKEVGRGHSFQPMQLQAPSWCDKCGDFIWGAYKQCLRCKHCEYTCHHKCRPLITLDCPSGAAAADKDDADSGYHTGNNTLRGIGGRPKGEYTLTRDELRRNIQTFNTNQHGLIMTLQPDSNTFQGFIRVHMNLIRPINMSLSARPPSIYEVLTNEEPCEDSDTKSDIASFYLPKDTTKVIHIKSDTTTQDLIKALLTKFRITDNPRKFALYEKLETPDQKASMHRLNDTELPLPICLSWCVDEANALDSHKFVLQENDAGDILWEAFSIPELENFVRMLDREEADYVQQLRAKYELMRLHMTRRLAQRPKTVEKRQPLFV